MAFYQLVCACLILVLLSRAESLTDETTVFRFSPLNIKDNYIVLQPNVSATMSTGIQYVYLTCLKYITDLSGPTCLRGHSDNR